MTRRTCSHSFAKSLHSEGWEGGTLSNSCHSLIFLRKCTSWIYLLLTLKLDTQNKTQSCNPEKGQILSKHQGMTNHGINVS